MNEIKFIPLVELATKKDKESKIVPEGTPLNNTRKWDLYHQSELSKNYKNIPRPISSGVYQYRLFDIEIKDLERAIKLHIADLDISESCSLFGGYAISVDDNIELYPQCCGLLEEIKQWKKILDEDFKDFYLLECHPAPLVTKNGNKIIIYCKDDDESFIPPTKEIIVLDYQKTKSAFLELIDELEEFSVKVNTLSDNFETKNIAEILIWGNNA